MEWPIMLAIIISVPLITLVFVFVWFVNLGGIYRTLKRKRRERAARKFELHIALATPKDC